MKKIMTKFIFALLFLAGLSLLLYPLISNEWNNYRQDQLISTYEQVVTEQSVEGKIDYAGERAAATEYNEALMPYILPDSFAAAADQEEPDQVYMSCLNLAGDGMMGYVEIPKIAVRLPVFHTTEDTVLQMAAGHLEGSSLPVGGEGTHAVISAHRGLPSAALFTDLDQLEIGDYFFLYILDEELYYQVDQITVTEPEDTSALAAEDDKDLVTLMTCTPYGVNSHRLLVRGVRVEYEEIEEAVIASATFKGPSIHTNYLLWVVVGLSVTAAFIVLFYIIDKRQKNRKRLAEKEGLKKEESSKEEPNKEGMEENAETQGAAQGQTVIEKDPEAETQAGTEAQAIDRTDRSAEKEAADRTDKSAETEAADRTDKSAETEAAIEEKDTAEERKIGNGLRDWQDDWPEGTPEGWDDQPEGEE